MIDHGYYQSNVDFWLEKAIDDIKRNYGHTVSVAEKSKDLVKFGRSEQVQTTGYTTLMTLPSGTYNETYPAANANTINYIVSSSAADTMQITIEGQTEADSKKTFVVQTKTLTGQTPVVLDTPLNRMTRLYVSSGTTDNAGTISGMVGNTVVAGVPSTGSDVHCQIRPGRNQSEKCSTTVSDIDYWIAFGAYADMLSKNDYNAEVTFEIRQNGSVFRPVFDMSCSKASGAFRTGKPYIVVRPNSDVRLRALASNANAIVSGGIFGTLAKIVSG